MDQNQMSKFCIELEGISMPDAIAAVVEAWYDAQNIIEVIEDSKEKKASCRVEVLNCVSQLVKTNLLVAGNRMPSIRDLANRIGFHRNSVLKVYEQLQEEGAILAKLGSGFIILDTAKLNCVDAI